MVGPLLKPSHSKKKIPSNKDHRSLGKDRHQKIGPQPKVLSYLNGVAFLGGISFQPDE